MRVAALALATAVALAGCWDKKEGDSTGQALQERRGDSVAAPGVAGPNATDTATSGGGVATPGASAAPSDSLRARQQRAAQQQGGRQGRRTP
jgi:hypothetical protein